MQLLENHQKEGLWFSQPSCLKREPLPHRLPTPAQAAACTSGMVGKELGMVVAGQARGQMPSGRQEKLPGQTGYHPHLPPSHKTCYTAASSFTASVRAALFTPHFGTSKSLQRIQHVTAGREAREGRSTHLGIQLTIEKRLSWFSSCSLETSTNLAVNIRARPGLLQSRGGFLCHRSLSPLPSPMPCSSEFPAQNPDKAVISLTAHKNQ